ncbi:hypothetical protein [Bacillus phage vB_BanS-Thrax3]|nr:hypothetical protein [Bacillus phage vB_BanS-Thrax3]
MERVYKFEIKVFGSIFSERIEIETDDQSDALKQLADIMDSPMAGMITEIKMEYFYKGVKIT